MGTGIGLECWSKATGLSRRVPSKSTERMLEHEAMMATLRRFEHTSHVRFLVTAASDVMDAKSFAKNPEALDFRGFLAPMHGSHGMAWRAVEQTSQKISPRYRDDNGGAGRKNGTACGKWRTPWQACPVAWRGYSVCSVFFSVFIVFASCLCFQVVAC